MARDCEPHYFSTALDNRASSAAVKPDRAKRGLTAATQWRRKGGERLCTEPNVAESGSPTAGGATARFHLASGSLPL